MLDWIESLSFVEFMALLGSANALMYLFSWILVHTLQKTFSDRVANEQDVVISTHDYLLSCIIVLLNIAAGIPGWWLWKAGHITLIDASWATTLWHTLFMFVYFDILMYVLHRVMHVGPLYRFFHERHHEHVDTNGISLYIMNPLESAGFGALLIGCLMLFPFSFHALIVFLLFNLLYGTMGHSGIPVNSRFLMLCVGDTHFHHDHHRLKVGNFGFFTKTWDKLFKTSLPAS